MFDSSQCEERAAPRLTYLHYRRMGDSVIIARGAHGKVHKSTTVVVILQEMSCCVTPPGDEVFSHSMFSSPNGNTVIRAKPNDHFAPPPFIAHFLS